MTDNSFKIGVLVSMVVIIFMLYFKAPGRYQPYMISGSGITTFDTRTGTFHISAISKKKVTLTTINPISGEVRYLEDKPIKERNE